MDVTGDDCGSEGGIAKGQRRASGDTLQLVPYLRVANVQRGYLDLADVKQIEASAEEIAELRLVPGDVLFNEGGDRDKLGRGWVWNGELPLCIHQNHVFRARIRFGVLHPKLLSWYANTCGQQYFLEHGKQTTNLASINMTKLGALPVPVPPLREQARILEEVEKHLSDIDAGVALTRARAREPEALPRGRPQGGMRGPAGAHRGQARAERGARVRAWGRAAPAHPPRASCTVGGGAAREDEG